MCLTMTPILSLGELGNHQLITCANLSTRRISCFVGLFIELWKVTKVQDVSFDFENKFLGVFPRVKLDDKKDYTDSGTKEIRRSGDLVTWRPEIPRSGDLEAGNQVIRGQITTLC